MNGDDHNNRYWLYFLPWIGTSYLNRSAALWMGTHTLMRRIQQIFRGRWRTPLPARRVYQPMYSGFLWSGPSSSAQEFFEEGHNKGPRNVQCSSSVIMEEEDFRSPSLMIVACISIFFYYENLILVCIIYTRGIVPDNAFRTLCYRHVWRRSRLYR